MYIFATLKLTAIVPNIYVTNFIATKELVFIKRYGWTQELNFKKTKWHCNSASFGQIIFLSVSIALIDTKSVVIKI
jgi:hypothetical protein